MSPSRVAALLQFILLPPSLLKTISTSVTAFILICVTRLYLSFLPSRFLFEMQLDHNVYFDLPHSSLSCLSFSFSFPNTTRSQHLYLSPSLKIYLSSLCLPFWRRSFLSIQLTPRRILDLASSAYLADHVTPCRQSPSSNITRSGILLLDPVDWIASRHLERAEGSTWNHLIRCGYCE